MRVWVTRDEEPDGPLSTALRAAGLTVVHEPVLARRVVNDAAEVISKLDADDWLVLTSVYAIEAVAREPARVPRVAVVSQSSRRAAEARGFRVELVSSGGDGKSLFAELRQKAKQGKVCYPRSSLAKAPVPWLEVELLCPVLYENVVRDFDHSVIDRVDVVSVTSPSAVEAIRAPSASAGCCTSSGAARPILSEAGKPTSPVSERAQQGLRFASIGPSTSAALRRYDIEPWTEAEERSFESLALSIAGMSGDSHG